MERKKTNAPQGFAARLGKSPLLTKIVYGAVAGILILAAILIAVVSAGNRKPTPATPAPEQNGGEQTPAPTPAEEDPKPEPQKEPEPQKKDPPVFVSPVVGRVIKAHSDSLPVYSVTLEDYRVHNGLDISTDEGAKVYAAEAGTVSQIYKDPLLGYTVELTHSDNIKTLYSNLDRDSLRVSVGQAVSSGAQIGAVGDSSISELCDEPHLHFEMLVNGRSVNPLEADRLYCVLAIGTKFSLVTLL